MQDKPVQSRRGPRPCNVTYWTTNAPLHPVGMSAYHSQTISGISNKIGFPRKAAMNSGVGVMLIIDKLKKKARQLGSDDY